MDQLATEGMRFTQAYATYPRRVPSRVGLLSGKYPSRVKFESDQRRGEEHPLPLSEVSFGEALQEAGYQTVTSASGILGTKAAIRELRGLTPSFMRAQPERPGVSFIRFK